LENEWTKKELELWIDSVKAVIGQNREANLNPQLIVAQAYEMVRSQLTSSTFDNTRTKLLKQRSAIQLESLTSSLLETIKASGLSLEQVVYFVSNLTAQL
jgi:hypothetical protein